MSLGLGYGTSFRSDTALLAMAARLCRVSLMGPVWSCPTPSSMAPLIVLTRVVFLPLPQGEQGFSLTFFQSSENPYLYPGATGFSILPPAVMAFVP